MPLCWWNKEDKVEREIHKDVTCHCHIINGSFLSIDVDGSILPCPQFINLPTMTLMKDNKIISKEKFLQGFYNENPKKIREKLSYVPNKKCSDCQYFGKRCTGGCPLIKFEIGPYAPFHQ